MKPARTLLTLASLLWSHAMAVGEPLTLLVDESTEMPFARIHNKQVTTGIHFDLGQELSRRLGRELTIVAVPRKRIAAELEAGRGDLACALLPEWLPAKVHWSKPFLPHDGVVVTLKTAPQPGSVQALAGQPIGTIQGYAYRELEQALGKDFKREDAPTASALLRKLDLGRAEHAAVNLQYLEYQRREGRQLRELHPYLNTGGYPTRCALSQKSAVALEALDRTLTEMQADGGLKRLLARYR